MTAAPITPAQRNALPPANGAPAWQEVPRGRRTPYILLALAALLLAVVVGAAAFFIGQSTRPSDEAISARVMSAVERTQSRDARAQEDALHAQANDARDQLTERVTQVRKVATKRGYTKGQEDGYASGSDAGYSSGYSSGTTTGHEQGVNDASDELICSDDKDVDLPSCASFWGGY
jgi:hypothetical protein